MSKMVYKTNNSPEFKAFIMWWTFIMWWKTLKK